MIGMGHGLRCATAALLLLAALPAAASEEEAPLVNWATLLPGLSPGVDPDSENLCKKGREACVHAVIREMERRWKPLSEACDHRALFALTYLRTTEIYLEAWREPGFFYDPAFMNHYDAVFADYYFRAFDDWERGRHASVPPAWRIAFASAQNREVSGLGNVLLGMVAHIVRDLPFVLHDIGLAAREGGSRKPDHDRVNVFLNRVYPVVIPELARRYDPTVDDGAIPGTTLDDFARFQVVPAWRETAWRHAEALANAPDEQSRRRVAQGIEDYARSLAEVVRAATAYGPMGSSASRDAYCALHHSDP